LEQSGPAPDPFNDPLRMLQPAALRLEKGHFVPKSPAVLPCYQVEVENRQPQALTGQLRER
jgi:hypothetical protein